MRLSSTLAAPSISAWSAGRRNAEVGTRNAELSLKVAREAGEARALIPRSDFRVSSLRIPSRPLQSLEARGLAADVVRVPHNVPAQHPGQRHRAHPQA